MCKLLHSLLYVTLMVPSCPGVELTWLTSLMMEKERGGRGGDDAGGSVREEEAGKPWKRRRVTVDEGGYQLQSLGYHIIGKGGWRG